MYIVKAKKFFYQQHEHNRDVDVTFSLIPVFVLKTLAE